MRILKGKPRGFNNPVILRITRSHEAHQAAKTDTAILRVDASSGRDAFRISTASAPLWWPPPGVYELPPELAATLQEGDIVKIESDGRVIPLWQAAAKHNAISLTDHCDSRCVVCPQLPETHPKHHADDALRTLSLLNADGVPPSFGITGGEPTLPLDGLVSVLDLCRSRFPDASVQLLTNGRRLSSFDVAARVSRAAPRRTLFCVPLFADNEVEHDAITGAPGSFRETIAGIHNLARHSKAVEIRVVILKHNAARLDSLAHFIFWNFPFAIHVAFMAMETSGVAAVNLEHVWIEPADYMEELRQAVIQLNQRMMNVSIYNIPLCLAPEELHTFARDSISDWKKCFLSDCSTCGMISKCAGFFATSKRKPGHIRPFPV